MQDFCPFKAALLIEAADDQALRVVARAVVAELKRRAGHRIHEDDVRSQLERCLVDLGIAGSIYIDGSACKPESMRRLRRTIKVAQDEGIKLPFQVDDELVYDHGGPLSLIELVDVIYESFASESLAPADFRRFRRILRGGPCHGERHADGAERFDIPYVDL